MCSPPGGGGRQRGQPGCLSPGNQHQVGSSVTLGLAGRAGIYMGPGDTVLQVKNALMKGGKKQLLEVRPHC